MVGLVELTPDSAQSANAITLNIELGRTKRGAVDQTPIVKLSDREFKYGNLHIIIHETNFKGSKLSDKADGMSADDGNRGPHCELHLVDEANINEWSETRHTYEGTYYALIELRRADSRENSKASIIQDDSVNGISVEINGTKYTTIYNSGSSDAPVQTQTYTPHGKSSLFVDRNSFTKPAVVPSEALIPSKQSIIIVSGNEKELHLPGIIGWENFISHFERNKGKTNE